MEDPYILLYSIIRKTVKGTDLFVKLWALKLLFEWTPSTLV